MKTPSVFPVKLRKLQAIAKYSFIASVLMGFLLPAAPAQAEDAPSAMLASASGTVTIHRAGEAKAASFGAQLKSGDKIEAGKDGKASVLFSSGKLVELASGSSISIGGTPEADGDVLAQMNSGDNLGRFAQTASGDEGLSVLPNLRSSDNSELTLLHPRNTVVRAQGIMFKWSEVPDALEYTLRISGTDGTHKDFRATSAHWKPGKDMVFKPNERYDWSVQAITEDGELNSGRVHFGVATVETAEAIAKLETALGPLLETKDATRAAGAQYLMGSYLRTAGLYGDAIVYMETIIKNNPDHPELHRELGALYEAVGHTAKAAACYRRALDES